MATLSLAGVGKRYDGTDGPPAVDDVSFEVADGGFLVLVGPSGCGKSTVLKMIAGLEDVTTGEIRIDGEVVNEFGPRARDVAMVFQSYALYPHLTVRRNIAYPLRVARVPRAEVERRVGETAELLQLTSLLDRRPAELSGGQRQRVAMGRAIVRRPRVFLMDEPLSNLDAKLRVQMRAEISDLQRELGITTVYVTHDQVEAMTMGTEVAVFLDGRLQQRSTPRVLYDRPANQFVAGFIGSPPMNLVDTEVVAFNSDDGRACEVGGQRLVLPAGAPLGPAVVGMRPESLRLDATTGDLTGTVTLVEELGAEEIVHVRFDPTTKVLVRTTGASQLTPGDPTHIAVDANRLHFFDPSTGSAV